MANKYISLQGRFYLAEISAGVAGALRFIGNVPEFTLEIGADILEHKESTTGQRTTDFTMVQTTSVNFSGQLEEIDKENLQYILSGKNHTVTGSTVEAQSLGTVKAGEEIKLDGYNLTQVSFTDSAEPAATIDESKYTLDPVFGTVIFKDVAGITTPVKATYTKGAVTHTTFASDFSKEYMLFFKGVNTANGDNVAVTLHRTKKSPETEFPLIHEELGQYAISGQALSDASKAVDGELGLYGYFVTIPAAA
ncbi:hypothetical protein ABEF79_08605 [Acinetobacter sp. ANC 7454]|uniref:phage tail tube protein n=1 Tax=Acinetobacter thermotolerans TaxID=3151487 RepID=UPI00325AF342